jgi:ferric iron reductase protein FhuF
VTLDDVLKAVAAHVPYLRASTTAPEDEGWVPSSRLCQPGPALMDLIATTGAGRGTQDPQVAASLFVQAYAFRIAGVALAAYALELPVPDPSPDRTAIRIDRHRPAAVAFLSERLDTPEAGPLAAALLEGHLRQHVDAVRDQITVGERLLWGNVAASCAVAFRAVESASGGRVRERADAFFAAAEPWLGGLGRFTVVTALQRDGWYWDRTSCCLWYQASGGSMCDDCSLLDAPDLEARRRQQLQEADS